MMIEGGDDTTHAAVHRKAGPQESAALSDVLKEKAVTGDRPTSGKHWARAHQYGKRKGTLQQPNQDPL